MLTIRRGLLLAATLALGGCLFDEAMLPETLHFLRNPHHLRRQARQALRHRSLCPRGTGRPFLPDLSAQPAHVQGRDHQRTAGEGNPGHRRRPPEPHFIVVDDQGRRLLSTTGNHDDMANIQITY
jgi:hypothetical protein